MSSRSLSRMGMSGLGGMGQFGGAFLLVNALSGKIYELIAESTQTIVKGYEQGGLIGLIQSDELRALFRRYLWLISVAFAFERLRWLWTFLNGFSSVTRFLYIDATLRTGDQAYEWMIAFWEHSKEFKKRSRDFVIETGPKGTRRRAREGMMIESIYDMSGIPTSTETDLSTRITPKDDAEQWIWQKGSLFRLRKRMQTVPGSWQNGTEAYQTPTLSIRSYSLTRKPLYKLLKQAKKVYDRTRPKMISIRVLDARGSWRRVAYKARRPLSSIIMDADKRQALLDDAKEFLRSEDWYAARGLRWNRGYLLHGAPGTGKSSTIQALASEIKLDVYIISINSPMMNDSVLAAAMRSIPPKSIVCIEDVDAVFSSQKRELDTGKSQQASRIVHPGIMHGMMRMGMNTGGGSNISLSAALNAIDGVESNEGRLLMMSTNVQLDELDAALTRPGRCDMFILYKRATREQAEELFNVFYTPTQASEADSILEELAIGDEQSPNGSPSRKTMPDLEPACPAVQHQSAPMPPPTPKSKSDGLEYHPFELPASVTKEKIGEWAKLWAAQVNDEQFTIAELQGMLLSYKKDPEGAMKDMPKWVVKELEKREIEAEKDKAKRERAEVEAKTKAATEGGETDTGKKKKKKIAVKKKENEKKDNEKRPVHIPPAVLEVDFSEEDTDESEE